MHNMMYLLFLYSGCDSNDNVNIFRFRFHDHLANNILYFVPQGTGPKKSPEKSPSHSPGSPSRRLSTGNPTGSPGSPSRSGSRTQIGSQMDPHEGENTHKEGGSHKERGSPTHKEGNLSLLRNDMGLSFEILILIHYHIHCLDDSNSICNTMYFCILKVILLSM
jgi:hypothetical protein